jgi:hypothetical protein
MIGPKIITPFSSTKISGKPIIHVRFLCASQVDNVLPYNYRRRVAAK